MLICSHCDVPLTDIDLACAEIEGRSTLNTAITAKPLVYPFVLDLDPSMRSMGQNLPKGNYRMYCNICLIQKYESSLNNILIVIRKEIKREFRI